MGGASSPGPGGGRDCGRVKGPRGDVLVGALLMKVSMRVGTRFGVTLSMTVKAGRRRTLVGSS